MKYYIALIALTIIAAPTIAVADDSRTAGYGASNKAQAAAPLRRAAPPVATSTFSGRSTADKAKARKQAYNTAAPRRVQAAQKQAPTPTYRAPTRRAAQETTVAGDTVRKGFGFKSSPEYDEASRASVLSGRRNDPELRERNLDPVPRIQELGF